MKSLTLLIIQVPAFDPNKGGVQRITHHLGQYFHEHSLSVGYFSFEQGGHIEPSSGELFHAKEPGSIQNRNNRKLLLDTIHIFQPDIIINQMPYEVRLRAVLEAARKQMSFKLIACIHNSLFAFKNNVKDILSRAMPVEMLKPVATSRVAVSIANAYHKVKHAKELRSILDLHDKTLLYTPPNQMEFKYFVARYQETKVGIMPNPMVRYPINEIDAREKIILHVGRINVSQKRSDLLVPFWEQCHAQIPDWHFIIVGDGPYLKQAAEEAFRKRLPRIEFVGFQDPMPYYNRASIFMMPSAFEGFPNTILEAQSFGLPVLAFDSYPALSWIVNDGKDALLSPPFNVSHMAEKAAGLALDSTKRVQMARNASHNVDRFSIDVIGQQWLALFNELLHGHQ